MPPSPRPMELRFLTEPPSETQAYPLHALPSRNGASIGLGIPLSCWGCRELPLGLWRRVLGSSGTGCPTDMTTDSPWHLWGRHVPVPPRGASFSVDTFSAKMPLSSDPAQLGEEMWPIFEPPPPGRGGHQRFRRRGQSCLPWPLQLLSQAPLSLQVETFGEWFQPLTVASLELFTTFTY